MGNPCPGYSVTTPFGQPGGWAAGYHTGEDYAAPKGALVHAAAAGTVIEAGWQGDYGNRVDIRHDTDNVEHSYSHLDDMWVTPGAHVAEGEAIGLVGSTGNSTGPHLHYEEREEPFGYNDHREPRYSGTSSGGEYPRPTSGTVYLSKLRYGQADSDSVWYLQEALNAHSLPAPGNITLPLTGGYWDQTGTVVVTCQQQHGFGDDPVAESFVGPAQAQHLFAGRGITIVDDT